MRAADDLQVRRFPIIERAGIAISNMTVTQQLLDVLFDSSAVFHSPICLFLMLPRDVCCAPK